MEASIREPLSKDVIPIFNKQASPQAIHSDDTKGIFIHYLLKRKKEKKKKTIAETYLKKHFHPHLNGKVSLFGNLRKL